MPEMILPGVYIEEHAEGLIVGAPISTGNIGIVGTAQSGPIGEVVILSSFADALQQFGLYDEWPDDSTKPRLTLTRALEQIYANGSPTVYAVRVTGTETPDVNNQQYVIPALDDKATTARPAEIDIRDQKHDGVAVRLIARDGSGAGLPAAPATRPFGYGTWGDQIEVTTTKLTPTQDLTKDSRLVVTIEYGGVREQYTARSGSELANQVNNQQTGSVLVTAVDDLAIAPKVTEGLELIPVTKPLTAAGPELGKDGDDAGPSEYEMGLELLLDQDVQIVVAAGRGASQDPNQSMVAALLAHVQNASSDVYRRERIAVVGSVDPIKTGGSLSGVLGTFPHSDRLVFVSPGIQATDAARPSNDPRGTTVTLPGAYSAAAIAGMLSARDPQVSLTHQPVAVTGLETKFNPGELQELILGNVMALQDRNGPLVVKSITTDTGAYQQVSIRRIVDALRNQVRNTAEPFIGLLNDDRVRTALQGAISGVLTDAVNNEMIEVFDVAVTATRDQEIRGIAVVTLTVQPIFSIDYIQVVMYLQ